MWVHEVVLGNILPRENGKRYPKCLDGARACPVDGGGRPPAARTFDCIASVRTSNLSTIRRHPIHLIARPVNIAANAHWIEPDHLLPSCPAPPSNSLSLQLRAEPGAISSRNSALENVTWTAQNLACYVFSPVCPSPPILPTFRQNKRVSLTLTGYVISLGRGSGSGRSDSSNFSRCSPVHVIGYLARGRQGRR